MSVQPLRWKAVHVIKKTRTKTTTMKHKMATKMPYLFVVVVSLRQDEFLILSFFTSRVLIFLILEFGIWKLTICSSERLLLSDTESLAWFLLSISNESNTSLKSPLSSAFEKLWRRPTDPGHLFWQFLTRGVTWFDGVFAAISSLALKSLLLSPLLL